MLLITVVLYSCRKTTERIIIISTNDIHAQISGFPRFAAFVEQKRAEGGQVILVDAGDRFSGNPYVDNAIEKGQPMIQLMNKMGYDLAAMGNHDYDYGQEVLKKRIGEAKFGIICANMVGEGSELGQLPSYQMLERDGIKFCFFSLIRTASNHIPETNPANLKDISFRYYKDVAEEYKKLAAECDVMIGLTHLGFYNDSLLALVMPELDVIIGGHSHTVISNPKIVNGVLISQTGSYLNYAGVTTLIFEGKKLVDKDYGLVSLKDIGTENQDIALMVEEINNRPEFKKVLGRTVVDLEGKENVASMVTDAMCDTTACDFAFYNKGGIRISNIPQGNIVVETVYKIEPFSNYIVIYNWTLKQMKEFILKDYNKMENEDERYINYYISAGKYEIVRDNNGEGIEVRFYDKDGKLLKDGFETYRIGLSNYVASSSSYVKDLQGGLETDIHITDAIFRFLQKKEDVAYTHQRAFIK